VPGRHVKTDTKSMSVGALVPTVGSFGRTWNPVTLWGLGDSAAPETSLWGWPTAGGRWRPHGSSFDVQAGG
jgi:hypothetical protein